MLYYNLYIKSCLFSKLAYEIKPPRHQCKCQLYFNNFLPTADILSCVNTEGVIRSSDRRC